MLCNQIKPKRLWANYIKVKWNSATYKKKQFFTITKIVILMKILQFKALLRWEFKRKTVIFGLNDNYRRLTKNNSLIIF